LSKCRASASLVAHECLECFECLNSSLEAEFSRLEIMLRCGHYTSSARLRIDLLHSRLTATPAGPDPRYGLIYNRVIDDEDVRRLVEQTMGRPFGDADLDGDVDIEDFNTLAVHFDPLDVNSSNPWDRGDFDGDLDIDIADFNELARNFSSTPNRSTIAENADSVAVLFHDSRENRTVDLHNDERPATRLTRASATRSTAMESIVDQFVLDVTGHPTKRTKLPADLVLTEL